MVEVKFTSSIRSKKGDDASSHQLLSKNYNSLGENFQTGANVALKTHSRGSYLAKNFIKKGKDSVKKLFRADMSNTIGWGIGIG